jgi:hypothetical protein
MLKIFLYRLYKFLFFVDKWNVGIANVPIQKFLYKGEKPKIKWLHKQKKNIFISDPFVLKGQNNTFSIMVETFDYQNPKGCISVIDVCENKISKPKIVFDFPFHLSYPYLFEYNNEIYCVPESSEAREVCLYKAKAFPLHWEKIATLIKDIAILDSTIIHYNDFWWLFATYYNDGPNYKLRIWYALDLLGSWLPHKLDPVKMNASSSRPAGTPFFYKGQLYRPSQDCSKTYGGGIVINLVKKLTPEEFIEEAISTIYPYKNSNYPHGVHTISSFGNITVIDGKREVPIINSFSMFLYKLKRIWILLKDYLQ